MTYKERLKEIQANLKFLELNEAQNLGKITIPKGFTIPINRDSVKAIEAGEFSFNFFHIVQNMLFCVALCDDLPLNEQYTVFLKNLFDNTEKKYLEVLLDVRFFEEMLYKAGIILGYSKYANNTEAHLMSAYEFIDLYQVDNDEAYLEIARQELISSYKMEKRAYTAYLLSFIYHTKKEYDLAMDYAEYALALNPDEKLESAIKEDLVEIKTLLDIQTANEFMAMGDYKAALSYLTENKREDSWEQNYMLGEIYLALEMPYEAMDNLKQALEINQAEPDIYEALGIASYFLGDVTNSIKFLEHGLKLDPKHIEILKNLATLYSKTQRSDIAIKLLDKAKVFYPDDDEIDMIIDRIKGRLQ